ncbi:MAG TPA: hypothetical protein VL180_05845 [Burkholderiales bacterium]|jgi:hypothetical protein|nr:hypothetical protein [Ramlibacter sp.]HTN27290.1 hypothetical protein [Burkholderiales bacterium]
MFNWFSSGESQRFGKELAMFILAELSGSADRRADKFTAKAEKVLVNADKRVRDFKTQERMNFYKKAKLANAFLWTLKDNGCSEDYANKLTDWLSVRL